MSLPNEQPDDTIELGYDSDQRSALMPLPQQQAAMVSYDPFGALGKTWSSFPVVTRADKVLLMKCRQSETLTADSLIGQEFRITHVVVHPVEIEDETNGEIVMAHRTIIRLADGRMAGFVSGGILRSLSLIYQIEGQGPWSPGVLVRLRQVPIKGGHRTFCLDMVEDNSTPHDSKTKAKRNV